MMDGSNDQGWGFLVLCAVGLFTAHFLKPRAETVGPSAGMGQDERVVETDSSTTDLTVDAADPQSADMAMDKSYAGPVTVDVSSAAPAAATNTSRGERPRPDQGPASGTRSRSGGGGAAFGEVDSKVDGRNVTEVPGTTNK